MEREFLRTKAVEFRKLADRSTDRDLKAKLRSLAEQFDVLADELDVTRGAATRQKH